MCFFKNSNGDSLVVQWLILWAKSYTSRLERIVESFASTRDAWNFVFPLAQPTCLSRSLSLAPVLFVQPFMFFSHARGVALPEALLCPYLPTALRPVVASWHLLTPLIKNSKRAKCQILWVLSYFPCISSFSELNAICNHFSLSWLVSHLVPFALAFLDLLNQPCFITYTYSAVPIKLLTWNWLSKLFSPGVGLILVLLK